MVIPHLEYAVQLWSQVLVGDFKKIEKVQDELRGSFMGSVRYNTNRDNGDLI